MTHLSLIQFPLKRGYLIIILGHSHFILHFLPLIEILKYKFLGIKLHGCYGIKILILSIILIKKLIVFEVFFFPTSWEQKKLMRHDLCISPQDSCIS